MVRKIFIFGILFFPFMAIAQKVNLLDQNKNLAINNLTESKYREMNINQLRSDFLPFIWAERDSLLKIVRHQKHDQVYIRYYYALKMSDLSNKIITKLERETPWFVLADSIFINTKMPNLGELVKYPVALDYLNAFMDYKTRELFWKAKQLSKTNSKNFIGKELDYSEEFLQNAAKSHGDLVISLFYVTKCLAPELAEYYLNNKLEEKINRKEIELSKFIATIIENKFPESQNLIRIASKVHELELDLEKNLADPEIVFLRPDSINSLHELVEKFRGKVIYLDIWGSWCAPCQVELSQHTHALKEHFANDKDLIFVYLSMETSESLEKWREFIGFHNLKGFHLAKNNQEIEVFWMELLSDQSAPRLYPTYAIFDRKGQLVTPKALRPSNKEALYNQIEEILKSNRNTKN